MASMKQKVDQCLAQLGCEKAPTIPEQVKQIATELGVLDELNNKSLVQQVDYVYEVMFGTSPSAVPVVHAVVVAEGQNPQMVEAVGVPVKGKDANTELSDWLASYPVSGGPRPDQFGAYDWFDKTFGGASAWPLQRAAMRGEVDTIKRLCREGQNPNVKMTAWYDSEPLGWAASFGQLGAVIALIQLGADPLLPPNKAGNTPLSDAKRERHSHVVTFLQEYEKRKRGMGGGGTAGAPIQQTMGSSSGAQHSIFDRSVHANGGPRHDQNVCCTTVCCLLPFIICPTHCLSMWGCADAVDCCTSTPGFKHIPCTPCDPNSKNPLWCCAEPLGWAASFGQLHTVMALVKNGAVPDTMNAAKQNAWTDAGRERHQHVVDWLNLWVAAGRPRG